MKIDDKCKIINAFGLPQKPNDDPIPRKNVLRWMKSKELEVLGVIDSYISSSKYNHRIDPPLELGDIISFKKRYLSRCLIEGQESDWISGRYEAAWEIAAFFSSLWSDSNVSRDVVNDLKKWLGHQYAQAAPDIRVSIVNGTLEHLFEVPEIANYFSDWKDIPDLCSAYLDAKKWSNKD